MPLVSARGGISLRNSRDSRALPSAGLRQGKAGYCRTFPFDFVRLSCRSERARHDGRRPSSHRSANAYARWRDFAQLQVKPAQPVPIWFEPSQICNRRHVQAAPARTVPRRWSTIRTRPERRLADINRLPKR